MKYPIAQISLSLLLLSCSAWSATHNQGAEMSSAMMHDQAAAMGQGAMGQMSMGDMQQMQQMQQHMASMQQLMQSIQAEPDAAKRQQLLKEHLGLMQSYMTMMHQPVMPMHQREMAQTMPHQPMGEKARGTSLPMVQDSMAGGCSGEAQLMMNQRLEMMDQMIEQMAQHQQESSRP